MSLPQKSPQKPAKNFTHLHLHTEYSMLDGANKLNELARTLKSQGARSVAMTDHGNMFGAIDFYQTMRAAGIKPIIGIETYLHTADTLGDKSSKQRFHLCLYAKDEGGYENLMYLSSQSFIEGLYYYPRINKKILRERSEGLICSSACLQGEINWHLNVQNERNKQYGAKGYEGARAAAEWYLETFGEDFYLELMRHGIADQRAIDDEIIRLSKELGIKLIATNDTHYTFKDRAAAHEVFMCISMGKKLDDPDRLRHSVHEFYVKSPAQMCELFADIPEAIANTQEVVNKCNVELKLGNPTPPRFKFTQPYAAERNLALPEEGEFSEANDNVLFEKLSREGLAARLAFIPAEKHAQYQARLELEIKTIEQMHFSGYMLIVHDFIKMARQRGIPVGPGRGSAAGSLVAYALEITDIDPLPYNLLFERFLNPERVSMPDIDVDFCQDKRGEVIDYVIDKYGPDKVAQVVTFNKLLAKGVIRDVARVLDVSIPDADALAKLIPEELKITLSASYEKEPRIKEFLDKHPRGEELWSYARALEGLNRNAGMHAAGLVISNEPLWKKIPLFRQSKNDERHLITQYSKNHLEDVDLIKFDFLGLKTLTLIDNAIKIIHTRHNHEINWQQVDVNDPEVYKTIQSGNTLGIFQIESSGMQALNARLRPENFEDLIAVLALYRPGPMESGMMDDFIERKQGQRPIIYPFDSLAEVLRPTYGIIVYQEQVMQIVQIIGGFSLGGADLVRRAMGKKDPEKMAKLKEEFVTGASSQGYEPGRAGELWELIVKFAGYGFNKSHSAAYGLITFQTAYLKTYYPNEFMAALLTSEENKTEKVGVYIEEMRKMKIRLLPPCVNKGRREFNALRLESGEDAIIYGLGAIKSVGTAAVENLLKAREDGEFKDLRDFLNRIDPSKVHKGVLEHLAKAGALDTFGLTRKCLVDNVETLSECARTMAETKKKNVGSLIAMEPEEFKLELRGQGREFELMEKLNYEKAILGIYVSGHPLEHFAEEITGLEYVKSLDFDEITGEGELLSIGKVENFKLQTSKSGKSYARAVILDLYSSFEVMIFSNTLAQFQAVAERGEEAMGFVLNYKSDEGKLSFFLKAIKSLAEIKTNPPRPLIKYGQNREAWQSTPPPPSPPAPRPAPATPQAEHFSPPRGPLSPSATPPHPHEAAPQNQLILQLDLAQLDEAKVEQLAAKLRAAHERAPEHKRVILRVRDGEEFLIYESDFFAKELPC